MERLTKITSWICGLFLISILIYILSDIFISAFPNFDFQYLSDYPQSAGRKGGIAPILTSTLLILFVCMVTVIPLGTAAALYLTTKDDGFLKHKKLISKSVEVLSSIPSIVFGLFGNAFFSIYLGFGFSILSGGLTLALMALPLYINTLENGIRTIPNKLHISAQALSLSEWTYLRTIVIPMSLPAICAGAILSTGRALAETAALIFTSGYVDRMPESLWDSGRALSVHIYDLTMNVPGGDINAYKSSMVLILLILGLNSLFNLLSQSFYKKAHQYEY